MQCQIFIKDNKGTNITLEVENADTIESVKQKIEDRKGYSQEKLILVFENVVLSDDRTLEEYSIGKNATIQLTNSIYKKYEFGDTIYLNPITLKTCEASADNCMKWHIVNTADTEIDNKITLLKDGELTTSVGSINYSEITGCFLGNNARLDESINENACPPEWWKTQTYNIGNSGIDVALQKLRSLTNSWNNKLTLNGTYGKDDLTGYKSRLLVDTEVNSIYNLYGHSYSTALIVNAEGEKTEMLFPISFRTLNAEMPAYSNLILGSDKYKSFTYGVSASTPMVSYHIINVMNKIASETTNTYFLTPVIEVEKEYLEEYNIIKEETTNGTFTTNVSSSSVGDNVEITTIPNNGYTINEIKVLDSNNEEIEVNNNLFVMPRSNVKVIVTFKPIIYTFVEGKNATYNNNDLLFKLNGDYSLLDSVFLNEKKLDDKHYEKKEGSTIITIKKDYLKTLSVGTHKLKVTYTNGSADETTFIIPENNPKTLDNIVIYVYSLIIGIISLVITGTYIYKKN